MFTNKEVEENLKKAVSETLETDFAEIEKTSAPERLNTLKNALVYVRHMTMETEADAAFRVLAVQLCDKLLLSLANDITRLNVPEKYRDVYTLSQLAPWDNYSLLKHQNLNGYFLAKITGGKHYFPFGSSAIKYPFYKYVSNTVFPKLKPDEFTVDTYKEYITGNAHKIDILILPNVNNFSAVMESLYKKNNKNGKVFITADINRQLIDANYQMKPEFIQPYFRMADAVAAPAAALRDRLNADPENKFPTFLLRHSFANATGGDLSVNAAEKENIILSVGRLDAFSKNIVSLVSAFSQAAELLPDWKLVLAGPISEDSKRFFEVRFANVKNRIIYTGELEKEELYAEYKRAKIFCMPTLDDVTPLVCAEAMAMGCYQVLSDSMDGAEDLTRDGEYGIVYEQEKYITHPELFVYEHADGYNGEAETNLAAALVEAAHKLDYNFMKNFIPKSKKLQQTEFDYDINAQIMALLLFA